MQDAVSDAFDGGPTLLPPPSSVRAPSSPLTPASLAQLHWPPAKAIRQTPAADEKSIADEIPTVLNVVAVPMRGGLDLAFTLLDAHQVIWQGKFPISHREVASLPIIPPLNQKILDFVLKHKGEQVGNGECWTLADEAFKAAGTTHPDVYVWGQPLRAGDLVLPGDVVQFTSLRLESNGSSITFGAPVHTALIERVRGPGIYLLLHQNFGGKTVTELAVDFNTRKSGDFIIYRPMASHTR